MFTYLILPRGSSGAQGAFQGGKIARAKRLDARFVVTVKRRDPPRAARILGFLWVGKLQPQMEGVHWLELRVLLGVLGVHLRRWHAARGDGEHLFAKDSYETPLTVAFVVGVYVALVPGDTEGIVRLLEDEQGERRVLGRAGAPTLARSSLCPTLMHAAAFRYP
jgi:hypothetical protein